MLADWYPQVNRESPYWLYLLDVRTRALQRVHGIADFAWSPDSQRLFVRYANQVFKIRTVRTGREQSVRPGLRNATWPDEHTIIGDAQGREDTVLMAGPEGNVRRRLRLRFAGTAEGADWMAYDPFYPRWRDWHPLGRGRRDWLVEARRGMSDGMHHWCSLVDLQTNRWKPLRAGTFCGLSPDGRRFAVADHRWIGPYKRVGRRCGPLEIVTIRTGRARAITPGLVRIAGGDWRKNGSSSSRCPPGEPRARLNEALLDAVRYDDVSPVHRLLARGADVNARGEHGRTPLLIACGADQRNRSPERASIVRLLLAKGADPNARDAAGETPLQSAASWAYDDTVALLLRKGGDGNARDSRGNTALIYAASRGDGRTVQALLNRNVEIRWRNRDGKSALDYARENRDIRIIAMIRMAAVSRARPVDHRGAVHSVAFSPDGRRLASAGDDGVLRLWSTRTGRLLRAVRTPHESVLAVAFSPDGDRLASGGTDRRVCLWRLPGGRLVRRLATGIRVPVTALAFSRDGRWLAVGSGEYKTNNEVSLWSLSGGHLSRRLVPGSSAFGWIHLALSPDSRTIAAGHQSGIALWDVRAGRLLRRLTSFSGTQNLVRAVAFTPDGKTLVSASVEKRQGVFQDQVRWFDVHTGRQFRTLTHDFGGLQTMAISPNGRTAAIATRRGTVALLNAVTGRRRTRLPAGTTASTELVTVAFSPHGRLLAAGADDGSVRVWDIATGRVRWTRRGEVIRP